MTLHDLQSSAGALFEPCPGGPAQRHFGNPQAEYAAARNGIALFDLSDRTQIEITGADRAKFLHNFCTNDIRGLKPGQGCEAFICNVQGKILGHIFAFAAPDSILIDAVPGAAEKLLKHLGKYHITEDVAFRDQTPDWGTLYVTGSRASATLEQLQLPGELLPPSAHAAAVCAGATVFVRRLDWLNQPGWEIVAPREKLAEVWTALRDAGAQPAGNAAWESLRLEACFPVYGVDITDENLAQEAARTPTAISFTKGCYLGQEPIARIDALGHVNRELRGIRFSPGPLPSAGTELELASDASRSIGRITSAATSLQINAPIALGYLKRHNDTPGLAVRARLANDLLEGTLFAPTTEPPKE